MKKASIVRFTTDDGDVILIESNDHSVDDAVRGTIKREELIDTVSKNFNSIMEPIKIISDSVDKKIKSLSFRPSEIEIEFGLSLNVKAGIVISSFDSEANFKIVLKWKT